MTNSIGMKLVLIPPGEFMMGSPDSDRGAKPGEKPQHRVRITRPFRLAMYSVTQAEYKEIMGTNPSEFTEKQAEASTFAFPLSEAEVKARLEDRKKAVGKDTSRHPVETVNWGQAMEFCRILSAMPAERSAHRVYRLPTEAEWEYACRAGTTTRWYCGDDEAGLAEVAWFNQNAGGMTHPVGEKKPNAWGLYDMIGNVCQWCLDKIIDYKQSPLNDPVGPPDCFDNVVRGSYWAHDASICRSAFRHRHGSIGRAANPGFRVVVEVVAETAGGKGKADGSSTGATPIPNPPSPIPPLALAPFDEKRAKEHQAAWARHIGVLPEMTNSIGMKLVLIPPGEFLMGSSQDVIDDEVRLHVNGLYESWTRAEGPQHRVRITRAFWLGATDVTQEEYNQVMGNIPSQLPAIAKAAVERVSWDDALEFCRKVSELPAERAAKRRYALPTEAQWEFACRAGGTTRYWFGDDQALVGEYAWFHDNQSGGAAHPVGQKKPNAWGLYDICGNVLNWCQDFYDKDYYRTAPLDDPSGPAAGHERVVRGGGWLFSAEWCRSAFRVHNKPDERGIGHGFRLALLLTEMPSEPANAVHSEIAPATSAAALGKIPGPIEPPAEPPPEPEKRLPMPTAAEQEKIGTQVEEAYKPASAGTPAQQVKLAKELVEAAEKSTKPDEQFVLLRKASELAVKGGDAALMFQTVDRMATQFELDGLVVKQKLLAKLADRAKTTERFNAAVAGANALIDAALADDRIDVALADMPEFPDRGLPQGNGRAAPGNPGDPEGGGGRPPSIGGVAGESPGPGRQPPRGKVQLLHQERLGPGAGLFGQGERRRFEVVGRRGPGVDAFQGRGQSRPGRLRGGTRPRRRAAGTRPACGAAPAVGIKRRWASSRPDWPRRSWKNALRRWLRTNRRSRSGRQKPVRRWLPPPSTKRRQSCIRSVGPNISACRWCKRTRLG